MKIQSVRGTVDVLPSQVWKWRFLEDRAQKIFRSFGYEEIRTPIFERTELFIRSVGETSDIVEKQMYTIPEEKGMGLTLRPEATAPVVRAYLEHECYREDRLQKFFYIGPMFRHERPQAGRLRQFHQMGVEALGTTHPALDAEIILLLDALLRSFGLEGSVFKINSVGCPACKLKYSQLLRQSILERRSELCEDCQRRFEKNILRVLDCKNPSCQGVLNQIPLLPEVLCEECQSHFRQVQNFLRDSGLQYVLTPKLVRGLDYYTRTIFEVTHAALGAQDAVAAGGRYDGLVESMDGPKTGAIGFAMGMERLLLALGDKIGEGAGPEKTFIFLAAMGEEAFKMNFNLQGELRKLKISSEMDYDAKSLKSQMRRANKMGVRFVLLRGEDEIKRGVVKLKNMDRSIEEEISNQEILRTIQDRFVHL